ncbi:unnamed protein product (macronuclear) [Paramecium tetraurelia]|uniref:Uncharacterized protein n=1 Tax=Paramecium tetraurelia TaxID=5888 RepID=A0C2I3_PARTE|nr:uncharacterized protein GSPATT00034478001 [Paramecium tetraurelia]CAK65000.1 unnamed protein product [Paramecium tetraurelia]|eukprot:XP_001432397.1 hypothetical protein (macronuclear) [Paramecium tetraurelia strain d4-2]
MNIEVLCPEHNEQIIQLDIEENIDLGRRTLCVECQGKKPVSLKQSFERLNAFYQEQQNNKEALPYVLIVQLETLRKTLVQEINSAIASIQIEINQRVSPLQDNFSIVGLSQLQILGERLSSLTSFQEKFLQKLMLNLKPQLYEILDRFFNQNPQKELLEKQLSLTKGNSTQEEGNTMDTYYKKINEVNIEDPCEAIAFNQNGNIMITTSKNDIFVWEFQKGVLNQQRVLREHNGDVVSLCVSRKQNFFFSGSTDAQIVVWYLWKAVSKLNEHKGRINCLVLGKSEEAMMSSSDDGSIRVWNYVRSEWRCGQVMRNHKGPVYQISLNDQNTLLVSTSRDNTVIVWEIKENQQWYQKYQLAQSVYGKKVCFVYNCKFVWVPHNANSIQVFEIGQKQLNKLTEMNLEDNGSDGQFSPLIYNKTRNILVQKQLNKVTLIYKPTSSLNVLQSIDLKDDHFSIEMTDEGNYLIQGGKNKFIIYQLYSD